MIKSFSDYLIKKIHEIRITYPETKFITIQFDLKYLHLWDTLMKSYPMYSPCIRLSNMHKAKTSF